MRRLISILVLSIFFVSCDKMPFVSSHKGRQVVDTIINYSKIDESPAFEACKQIFGNERTRCFRIQMRDLVTRHLKNLKLTSEHKLDTIFTINLMIDTTGTIHLAKNDFSVVFQNDVNDINNALDSIVALLPKLEPASKKDIYVNTVYKLPIRIYSK